MEKKIEKKTEKKILIIDDNVLSRDLNKSGLESGGFRVISVGNCNDGLEKLKSEKIDLIVLDLILPGLDGFGFLSIIKQDRATKYIPVVVLTCRDSKEETDEAMRLGALDCLIKYRTSPDALLKFVKTVLGE